MVGDIIRVKPGSLADRAMAGLGSFAEFKQQLRKMELDLNGATPQSIVRSLYNDGEPLPVIPYLAITSQFGEKEYQPAKLILPGLLAKLNQAIPALPEGMEKEVRNLMEMTEIAYNLRDPAT